MLEEDGFKLHQGCICPDAHGVEVCPAHSEPRLREVEQKLLQPVGQKKKKVGMRQGTNAFPAILPSAAMSRIQAGIGALLGHVHSLDAVAVYIVVEGWVLGATLALLPFGCARQHLAASPLS